MTNITYNKEKRIFLDIDGCLNSDKTLARTPSGCLGISSDKVNILREIVKATGAHIILSSSWRTLQPNDRDYKYLVRQLGYKNLKITDKTTSDFGYHRGKQIRAYLDSHPEIKEFVIIDDEFVQEFEECNLSKHLIHTDFTTGLTKKDITKAIKILNGDFDYINCEFSIDELRLLQGALKLCEDKQNFNLDETYLRSVDLRDKISRILKTNDTSQQHFGRPLEGA